MLRDDFFGRFECLLDQFQYCIVDGVGGFFAVVAPFMYFPSKKNELFLLAVRTRAEFVAHAVLGDDLSRKDRRFFQVVARAGRHIAEYGSFRYVTGEEDREI